MWELSRLVYIGQTDAQCSETFGTAPMEILMKIESFVISEPYIKPGTRRGTKRDGEKINGRSSKISKGV
jgi:hypothetical protein